MSIVNTQQLVQANRLQADPLANMTPESVKYAHNAFRAGRLAPAAILWEAFEEFDDKCNPAAAKAKAAATFHGWDIILDDPDDAVAIKHAKALKTFFNRISATDASDLNKRGGMDVFTSNLMDAEGKGYSAQEIIWCRRGGHLAAEMRFVPLQFFENTTGRLRYIENPYSQTGADLKPGHWITHWGRKIMMPVTVCGMYKRFSLQDWLVFCLRFGADVPYAKTPADPDDPEYRNLEEAIAALAAGSSIVVGDEVELDSLKFGASGGMPYEAMIERMDRAIATLWRGGDLSTISADTQGASVQGDEADILDNAAIVRLNGTINEQLVVQAVKNMFGEYPRAWFQQKGATKEDLKLDLEIDTGLAGLGVKQDPADLAERYGRKLPEKDEGKGMKDEKGDAGNDDAEADADTIACQRTDDTAQLLLANAVALDLQPVVQRLKEITADLTTPIAEALRAFIDDELPALAMEQLKKPGAAEALVQIYKDAL